MAKIHGKSGALYAASGIIRATTISFTAINTISDSGNGFVTAGFVQGQKIIVAGSTSNDHTYTITTGGVAADSITVSATPNAVEDEAAGKWITVYQAAPGGSLAGFFNWSLDWKCDLADVTDWDSSGKREFIAGVKEWSATAERNWHDTANVWFGAVNGTYQFVRFFVKYVASPSVGDPALFYEGLAIVTATQPSAPVDDAIKQTFNFQGVGALTPVTQTTSW